MFVIALFANLGDLDKILLPGVMHTAKYTEVEASYKNCYIDIIDGGTGRAAWA